MATVRIYKVAELLGLTSQEAMTLLQKETGITVKSASSSIEEIVARQFVERGATGYTSTTCRGAGRSQLINGRFVGNSQVRIEVIAPVEVCDNILDYLRHDVLPVQRVTASVETVQAVRVDQFHPVPSGKHEAEMAGHSSH